MKSSLLLSKYVYALRVKYELRFSGIVGLYYYQLYYCTMYGRNVSLVLLRAGIAERYKANVNGSSCGWELIFIIANFFWFPREWFS